MAKVKLNVAWPETYTPFPDLTASEASMQAAAVPAMIERGLTIFWGGHVLPLLFSPEKCEGAACQHSRLRLAVTPCGVRLRSTIWFNSCSTPLGPPYMDSTPV